MNLSLKQLVKLISCLMVCSIISGCTVLGFAADIGLATALDPIREAGRPANTSTNQSDITRSSNTNSKTPLFFTVEGMKQDAKVISGLLGDIKVNASDAQEDEPQSQKVTDCEELIEDKQQCHPSSYYQDMYIKTDGGE